MDTSKTETPKPTFASAPPPKPEQVAPRDNPDTMVPLVNHEARLHGIVVMLAAVPPDGCKLDEHGSVIDRYGKIIPTAREQAVHKVHPGLNFVPLAAAQRIYGDNSYSGRLEVAEPWASPVSYATNIANITMSKSALEKWLAQEQRPDVRRAIEKRLASGEAKAA